MLQHQALSGAGEYGRVAYFVSALSLALCSAWALVSAAVLGVLVQKRFGKILRIRSPLKWLANIVAF